MRFKIQSRRVREIKEELKSLCKRQEYLKLDSWQKETVQAYIAGKSHYGDEQGQLRTTKIDKSGLAVKNIQDLWKWDLYYTLGEGDELKSFLGIDIYENKNERVVREMCY